jgi:hypothetical protein
MSKKDKRFIIDEISGEERSYAKYYFSNLSILRRLSDAQVDFYKSMGLEKLITEQERKPVPVDEEVFRTLFMLLDYSVLNNITNKKELKISSKDKSFLCIDIGVFKFKIEKDDIKQAKSLRLNFLFERISNIDDDFLWDKYKEYKSDNKGKQKIFYVRFDEIENSILNVIGVGLDKKIIFTFIKKLKLCLFHYYHIKLIVTFNKDEINEYLHINHNVEDLSWDISKQGIKFKIFINGHLRVAESLRFNKLYLIGTCGYGLRDLDTVEAIYFAHSNSSQIDNATFDKGSLEKIFKSSWIFTTQYNSNVKKICLNIEDVIS